MKTKLVLIAITLGLIGYICSPWPGIPVALAGAALLSSFFSIRKKDKSLLLLAGILVAVAIVAAAVLFIAAPGEPASPPF